MVMQQSWREPAVIGELRGCSQDSHEGKGEGAWPYNKPQFLILNIAIGGDWGGQKGIDDSIFPQRMYIDYVRVYQEQNPTTQPPTN